MIKLTRNHIFTTFSFAIIFLLSSIVVINQPNKVGAIEEAVNYKTISKMTAQEQAASSSYYLALAQCVSDGHYNDGKDASKLLDETTQYASDIFANATTTYDVGIIAEQVAIDQGVKLQAGDGAMWCSNIAKAAFNLWGINSASPATILSALGYTNASSTKYGCIAYFNGRALSDGLYVSDTSQNSNGTSKYPAGNYPFYAFNLPLSVNTAPIYKDQATSADKNNSGFIEENEAANFCHQATNQAAAEGYAFGTVVQPSTNSKDYMLWSTPSSAWTLDKTLDIAGYIQAHVYENNIVSAIPLNTVPPNIKKLPYYVYKYNLEDSSACGGVNYGLNYLDSLESYAKTNAISSGRIDNFPYVNVNIVNSDGTTGNYTYVLKGEKAQEDLSGSGAESIPLWLNNSKTCKSMASELSDLATNIGNDIKNNMADYTDLLSASGDATKTATSNGTESDGGDATTCAINGIGWIICPVVNFLAKVVDDSWNVLVNFLKTDTSIVSRSSKTYQVWQIVRNVANVAFAIVFLIIIFSQVTSFGISNYGIKKMLPKLIIAAILVNVSFYLCQIAVDISNILGYSLKSIFDGFANGIGTSSFGVVTDAATGSQTGQGAFGLAGIVLTLAAGSVAAYALIGTLIPVLLGGLVALLMILFMLVGRQALIILLVILSPLAFVAYLLPNTEKLFDKWKKLFMSLLLLFPIVALVLGASSLASTILTTVFVNASSKNGSDFDTTFGQIAGAAVAILPLFVVPGMLKKSLDGVGNIGGTLNKLSDKWGKSAGDKWTGSKLNTHIKAERANKEARIQGGVYEGSKYNPDVWRSKMHRGINQSAFSGKYGDKMSAMGIAQSDKFNDENVGLATSRLNSLGLDRTRIQDIALGTDAEFGDNLAMRQAAIKDMVATNNVDGMNKLWDNTIKMDDSQSSKYIRNTFANSLLSSSSRPAYLGGGAIGAMRIHDRSEKNAQKTHTNAIKSAINNNTYSPEKIAHADADEMKEVNKVLAESSEYSEVGERRKEAKRISDNAKIAISDNKFDVSKNLEEVDVLSKLVAEARPEPAIAPIPQNTQPIVNPTNGLGIVNQNGVPIQRSSQSSFGGSNREAAINNEEENNNNFVIKDRRIR